MINVILTASLLFLSFAESLIQYTLPTHHPVVASGVPCSSLPFSDSFTRANGPLGSPWLQVSGGQFAIVSNTAQILTGTGSNQNAWPNCSGLWASSHYAQATFTSFQTGATMGLTVNTIDGNNYYYINCSTGGGCSVLSYIAGTSTFIGVFSLAPVQGDRVCLELDSGTTVKLRLNGTYDSTTQSVSGLTTGSSGGGIWMTATSSPASSFTNFSTDIGTCPP